MLVLKEAYSAVVVGAGQAGLCASHFLKARGVEHVCLERQPTVASAWRSRWNSFRLVTTNAMIKLPGVDPVKPDEGFLSRDEIIEVLDNFAAKGNLPVLCNKQVSLLSRGAEGFLLELSSGEKCTAKSVILASGAFGVPKTPSFASAISRKVHQIHSSAYKDPTSLPAGGVLVVGYGQSGAQIAKELLKAGRPVYISLGERTACVARRHRGRDLTTWLMQMGITKTAAAQNPKGESCRIAPNPALDWQGSLLPKELGRAGATLLGKVQGLRPGRDSVLALQDNLEQALAAAEAPYKSFLASIDKFIENEGIDAPPADDEALPAADWQPEPARAELDLDALGISTILWATGYSMDTSFLDLGDALELYTPGEDKPRQGALYPRQTDGIVETCPGLYFVGWPYLSTHSSGVLLGVAEDAERVVAHLCGYLAGRAPAAATAAAAAHSA